MNGQSTAIETEDERFGKGADGGSCQLELNRSSVAPHQYPTCRSGGCLRRSRREASFSAARGRSIKRLYLADTRIQRMSANAQKRAFRLFQDQTLGALHSRSSAIADPGRLKLEC